MNLFIYALRDDISQILGMYSLHDNDDTAISYYTRFIFNELLDSFVDLENKHEFLKILEERVSHNSLIKIGSINIISGEVSNLDNLIVLNNSNMYDYFNLILKERSEKNESNND